MGFLDKVKEMNEATKQYMQEKEQRKLIDKKQERERAKNSMIKRYNIYKGVPFKIYLPEKEIVIKERHGGITKGIMTLAFGLPGYATTNGIKQEIKQKTITALVQVVDAGIIFKKASEDNKDIRIPFEDIISFKEHRNKHVNRIGRFTLTLLENQTIEMYFEIYEKQRDRYGSDLYYVYEHIEEAINKKATGSQNPEELKWLPNSEKEIEDSKHCKECGAKDSNSLDVTKIKKNVLQNSDNKYDKEKIIYDMDAPEVKEAISDGAKLKYLGKEKVHGRDFRIIIILIGLIIGNNIYPVLGSIICAGIGYWIGKREICIY